MRKNKHKKNNIRNPAIGDCSALPQPVAVVSQEYEYLQLRHASYCKQRESCSSAGLEISGRYDQWIVTLPGGALALSLGFLEKIAPTPTPLSKTWLIMAWATLIIALASGFAAIFFSQRALERQIEILDEEFRRFKEKLQGAPLINGYRFVIRRLNWTSLFAFVFGLISLCTFAFKNLPTESRLNGRPALGHGSFTNKP
jgi:hypothetical protein